MEETMKKNLSLLAAFLVVGFCATPASAADHYISGMGGISWMNDIQADESYYNGSQDRDELDVSSGLSLAGAIGCDYGDYRLEAEIGYQKNEIDSYSDNGSTSSDMKGDVSLLSLMANGYYDFDLGGVELYATAGIGVAQVTFDDVYDDGSDVGYTVHETTLAYQIGAGIAVPVADNIKIDARYRYFATTDFTPDDVSTYTNQDMNIESHSVLLGLRVGF